VNAGTRLGIYDIIGPLGAGGMGEVYRARDTRLGREVALKVLPAEFAEDPDRLARFEHEARTVANLNHPNIVTLFTIEDLDSTRFLTMELIEGDPLDRHVESSGMDYHRVVVLGLAIVDALIAAHGKGVVHRDLKPGNIMLARDGRLKVLDFGLAKLAPPDPGMDRTRDATLATSVSVAGQVVGTVPYMAPEQMRGGSVDARTDLFALGIILYELAAGRRPFEGATLGLITSAILHDAPHPIAKIRPDVPEDLERIILRCLEKDPRARYQTAADVRADLERSRLTKVSGIIAKPPPTPPTPLLGREMLLQNASERLDAGARLLTITGYGGTGKTRFSIELYRRLSGGYEGGAAFISLASVTVPGEVLPTIGVRLDIAEAHGRSALDAVGTVIGDRRTLLILDNLEQVLEAADDIGALVARCPGLTVIATSRAPLKIGIESEFALPPLQLPTADTTSLEALAACPSVALLVQRAEKVQPGFRLDAGNAAAIAAICRRLDGLPLALELAAARIRILEPAALLQRLDHALDLLTSGDRDLPLRQRTLRATISWSYSLLDAAEQRLLRRASVFHEGWTLEAMEQVCYGAEERYRAVDELSSLVEKGLVRVVGGGERYALLETIRAFAAEQLHASGDVDAIRGAHAEYCLEFASRIGADLFGHRQLDAMRRGHDENANTQAAIHWLKARAQGGDHDALEKALLICGGLDWFWHIAAMHLTAREWLDPLLALAAGRPPSRGRAVARLAAGMVATTTGEWERSRSEWAGAFADADAVGDAAAAAEGRMGVGYCELSLGRMLEAGAALDDAIARSAGGVSDFMHAISKTMKGIQLFATGKLDAGMALVQQAIQLHASYDDHEGRGVATSVLAQMTYAKGDHALALVRYRQALEHLGTVGDLPEVARVHTEMGWTALAGNDTPAARRAFQSAVRTNDVVGSPRGTGIALLGLAAVEAAEGRTERAVSIAAVAEALMKRAGVVIAHPMTPGLAEKIEALKATVPRADLESLVAQANTLTPATVLAMVGE
jgi:non-specific serine/threonine protein kinase